MDPEGMVAEIARLRESFKNIVVADEAAQNRAARLDTGLVGRRLRDVRHH